MRFLLDTNILIPAEPTSHLDVEAGTPVVAALLQALTAGGHQWQIHPASLREIEGDQDEQRRQTRKLLAGKYPVLEAPPPLDESFLAVLGVPEAGSHDEIDLTILSALKAECADYLVTDDGKLRKRARRVGLTSRVLSAADAVATLRGLFPTVPQPPPRVQAKPAHSLNRSDPIFQSLRSDYPPFDSWFTKCRREQRLTWTIQHGTQYGGICIVNPETPAPYGLQGKTLKICTFKVSRDCRGHRYGELLLKTVFAYLLKNDFDQVFVEAFEKHEDLLELLQDFGFSPAGTNARGEVALAKSLKPTTDDMDPLDYHMRFGPYHVAAQRADAVVVPIQPRYHRLLFPEAETQLALPMESHPFGNSIRKAYLCRSPKKSIAPGSTVLFYRSHDAKAVTIVAVAEDILRSADPAAIARFVGRRTVYAFDEIQAMTRSGPVLALLFRQARILQPVWPLDLLTRSGTLKGTPQSIAAIPEDRKSWLVQQLQQ